MKQLSLAIVFIIASLSLVFVPYQAKQQATLKEFLEVFSRGLKDKDGRLSLSNFFDGIILDAIPYFWRQQPSNLDGKFEEFKEYVMRDDSNDDIALSSVEEIVIRSGYDIETYRVVADDSYITSLYRIINPKADKSKLKQPPVMVMHGGLIDPTIWVDASAKQHHPEKYPRLPSDGPITSSNRSLGFTLANNGYDVWLVGTRGSDAESQGRIPTHGLDKFFHEKNNMTKAEKYLKLYQSTMYWRYSFDDIISLEVPRQIDKILEVTGAKNLTLFTYSYSTTISLSLLGMRPDVAKKVHNYICMAPLINSVSAGSFIHASCQYIRNFPTELGIVLYTWPMRFKASHLLPPVLGGVKRVRYSFVKLLINLISGSAGKYRTLLEPSMLGHISQPLAFKQLQHSCQILHAKQYQKYSYGYLINKLIYGEFKPPKYDISNIHVKNWMLISGETDNFGCQSSVKQILDTVNPKPLKHLDIPGYGHMELVAGVDVDRQVIMPVLDFLNRFALRA